MKFILITIICLLGLTIALGQTFPKPDPKKPASLSEDKVNYDGYQLWRANADTPEKKAVIQKLEQQQAISVWNQHGSQFDILVKPTAVDRVKETFKANKITYKVLQNNVQNVIEQEKTTSEKAGRAYGWNAYYRLTDIHNWMNSMASSYPSRCSVRTIGTSIEGRAIRLLKVSNGRPGNKAVWVDGGIHAREWISPASVTYIINELVTNFNSQPANLQNLDWYFVPVMNPDGYEFTFTSNRMWRKNRRRTGSCYGTDLNRNFGYMWGGKGASTNPCDETYRGASAFSEPESAAVRNFITGTAANWKAYVTYHSYGQYILIPWGYDYYVPPDYNNLLAVGNQANAAITNTGGVSYRVGNSAALLYPAAGGSDDWGKSRGMTYSYTIELRDTGNYGFLLPAQYIVPTGKDAWAALKVIANAAYSA